MTPILVTCQRVSRAIDPDIFDWPSFLSAKQIGTSVTFAPASATR